MYEYSRTLLLPLAKVRVYIQPYQGRSFVAIVLYNIAMISLSSYRNSKPLLNCSPWL